MRGECTPLGAARLQVIRYGLELIFIFKQRAINSPTHLDTQAVCTP